ncbi:MAG TPA: hypothetical protein VFT49_02240 [Candidatus Saccharimonadales bacterium]|nr:hypothetical protein [Candidatus Saccharimonadales bacterium]
MTIKVTALLTSASVALMYVLSAVIPNDPYFFLISSNIAVAIGRVLLAAILVQLVFRNKFRTIYGHVASCAAGCVLIGFGIAGIVIAPLDYSLFSYIKPLDYIFMIGSGLLLTHAALGYERGTERLPRLSRPRNLQLRLFSTGRA